MLCFFVFKMFYIFSVNDSMKLMNISSRRNMYFLAIYLATLSGKFLYLHFCTLKHNALHIYVQCGLNISFLFYPCENPV